MTISISNAGPSNQLNGLLGKLRRLPQKLQLPVFDIVFGRFTPFYRSVGVKAVELGPQRVVLALSDRPRLRNHLGDIHAVAITLPAEYAAGLLVGQHVPKGVVVVVKAMHMELNKAIRGSIRAAAILDTEQCEVLRERPKGEISIPVTIEDQSGQIPMSGTMQIAWFTPRTKI